MKTSNKLLLLFLFGAILLFTGIHLFLYLRYKKGHILTSREIQQRHQIKTSFPQPANLLIRGLVEVQLIPSDTFALAYEKGGIRNDEALISLHAAMTGGKPERNKRINEPRIYRSGDTLVADGRDTSVHLPPGVFTGDISGVPALEVYGGPAGTITLQNAAVSIAGSSEKQAADYRLVLTNNTLFIGNIYILPGVDDTTTYIHSLAIVARGAGLNFGPKTHIHELRLDLNASILSNLDAANVDSVIVRMDRQSTLNANDALLKKIRFEKP